ncbi:hypothetical protein DL98DRAFT_589837 [Cadophora sp. DSE1049]|nr:hypothetical protein DL98DRAFT_589837 [Cadophora sp. DSE1049]
MTNVNSPGINLHEEFENQKKKLPWDRQLLIPIHLAIMKWSTLLALSFWAVDLCSARVVDYGYFNDSFSELSARQETDVTACISECSPETCGDATCSIDRRKRDLSQTRDLLFANFTDGLTDNVYPESSLAKRQLREVRLTRLEAYMDSQSALVPEENALCPLQGNGFRKPTFCVQYEFATLSTERQTLLGTANTLLTGCTVLTIVSARGVYMVRLIDTRARRRVGFDPFLRLLEFGEADNTPRCAGPALNLNLFNDRDHDGTYAFILTPRVWRTGDNDPNSVKWVAQIAQLQVSPRICDQQAKISSRRATIRRLLPNAGIIQRNYIAKRGWTDADGQHVENYDKRYQGVALFEYDPDADSQGDADWRLWYEEASEMGRHIGQDVI